MFFVVVYLHMFRGMMYGSYRKPRELLWLIGMGIFFVLMMLAFTGYILPWGQMSYWGAQVIISMIGAIPVIGQISVELDTRRLHAVGCRAQPFFCVSCRDPSRLAR